MSSNKVIITIAPTGGMASKKQNPSLPTQPEEIARDVIDCWNLGASVVGSTHAGQMIRRRATGDLPRDQCAYPHKV